MAGKKIPSGAFVSVWNLFYLANPKLGLALEAIRQIDSEAPPCLSEEDVPKIVWFAWGDSHPELNTFKARFREMNIELPFFYDEVSQRVIERIPLEGDFASHTQGMLKDPINEYLKSIL